MTQIDRAISHIRSLDDAGRLDTPLARVDARAKVFVTLTFLVTVASFGRHQLVEPLPLSLLLAIGLSQADVPIGVVGSRLALAAPFAILVGIWNPFFETEPMLSLGPVVLSSGWVSFLSVVERVLLGVTAVLLLIASTGMDSVATALGRMGMPRVLVTQLLLLYRYAFLLVDEVARILRAHALRAPERRRPEWRTVRSLLGELLLRSLARAERVHAAMLCRGFSGEVHGQDGERFRVRDGVVLSACTGYMLLVRFVDLPRLIGDLFS